MHLGYVRIWIPIFWRTCNGVLPHVPHHAPHYPSPSDVQGLWKRDDNFKDDFYGSMVASFLRLCIWVVQQYENPWAGICITGRGSGPVHMMALPAWIRNKQTIEVSHSPS
jgi:hypothetical protein